MNISYNHASRGGRYPKPSNSQGAMPPAGADTLTLHHAGIVSQEYHLIKAPIGGQYPQLHLVYSLSPLRPVGGAIPLPRILQFLPGNTDRPLTRFICKVYLHGEFLTFKIKSCL